MRVEICMISARGLPRRSSPIWKLQWFAVGWVDPRSKYCSRMDGSGGGSPTWRTKFAVEVAEDEPAVLTVEVRSREPIFLRERLHGTAAIPLRELMRKSAGGAEVGSFQLRGRRSGEARGFVDVSVRILNGTGGDPSGEYEYQASSLSSSRRRNETAISIDNGPSFLYPDAPSQPPGPPQHPYIRRRVRTSAPAVAQPHAGAYTPVRPPYADQRQPEHENSYSTRPSPPPHARHPAGSPHAPIHAPYEEDHSGSRPTPPPPPPPSNTGFIPSFFPSTYASLGAGVGAGALVAGAVLFGDDFMSGTGFPTGAGLVVD